MSSLYSTPHDETRFTVTVQWLEFSEGHPDQSGQIMVLRIIVAENNSRFGHCIRAHSTHIRIDLLESKAGRKLHQA